MLLTFACRGYIITIQIAHRGNQELGGEKMRNLAAEMTRYGVSNLDIKQLLGCSDRTVINKLSGETEFTISEAFKIRDKFFRPYRVEYLFAQDIQDGTYGCKEVAV